MPARFVEYACSACDGSGLTSKVCDCQRVNGYFPWFLDLLRRSCLTCRGTGVVSHSCRTCHGSGKHTCRIWLPDTVEETWELVIDLGQSFHAGSGAWVLVDALRGAFKHCDPSAREQLFPQTVLDRLDAIESVLPMRCSHCNGRGADIFSGAKCCRCKGDGYGDGVRQRSAIEGQLL